MNRATVVDTLCEEALKHERVALVAEGVIERDHLDIAARLREAAEIVGRQDMTENRLLYEIMQEIGKHGAVYRCNAGQYYSKSGQRVSGLPKGFSDILFIGGGGVACFIEAKVRPNKPTPEQVAFIEKMQSLGCRAGVAYSVADALEICGVGCPGNRSC